MSECVLESDYQQGRTVMFRKTVAVSLVILLCASFATASKDGKAEKGEDRGKAPWVVDIEELTVENDLFRETHWTGRRLQMTVMAIPAGGEIGLEVHPHGDQFIRVEEGEGRVLMGETEGDLTYDRKVSDDWAIFIPAGYWHNIVNESDEPLKVYVIYSPPEHPAGTVHGTFEEGEAAHHHHGHDEDHDHDHDD